MTYEEYMERIRSAGEFSDLFVLGFSLLSEPIYCSHVGSYEGKQAIVQCAIHAREYITSLLGVELARYAASTLKSGGAYFVYDVDPDGVRLVLDGASYITCDVQRDFLISANGGDSDFSLYKANANAVDLNTNFDAKWGGGAENRRCPSSESFIGYYPMSEREVNILADFTVAIRPDVTISYHTKGEVIYYGFEGQNDASLARDEKTAALLAAVTGYTPILTRNSTGGYKDWCIEKFDIPSFTIEVGSPALPHPLDEGVLPEIFEQNKEVLSALLS